MDETSKDNQMIYMWESDPIKCLDSTVTLQILTFMLIYSLGHVFGVSELFILWDCCLGKVMVNTDSVHTHITVFDLCCFSLSFTPLYWSMATLWGCVQKLIMADVFYYWFQLFSLLYALAEARIWKTASTHYPILIFLFIDSKCTDFFTKTV